MTATLLERITQLLADGPDQRTAWLESTSEQVQGAVQDLLQRAGIAGSPAEDLLHGTWLGHPLHPALVIAPAGAWTTAAILDLIGDETGARTAVGFGVLAALPTAAAGLVDWTSTSGRGRRLGLSHAILNGIGLGCYTASWLARKGGHGGLGVTLSTVGLGVVTLASYLGGEISYSLGQGVNRNAWSPDASDTGDQLEDFRPVARFDDLREGQLSAAELVLDDTRIPLVLMRRGREVLALNAVCSHMGGPLAEGRLVDEWCVECPWHGSRFDFRDGEVVRGPAAHPQPRYETRVHDGVVEARVARPLANPLDKILTSF